MRFATKTLTTPLIGTLTALGLATGAYAQTGASSAAGAGAQGSAEQSGPGSVGVGGTAAGQADDPMLTTTESPVVEGLETEPVGGDITAQDDATVETEGELIGMEPAAGITASAGVTPEEAAEIYDLEVDEQIMLENLSPEMRQEVLARMGPDQTVRGIVETAILNDLSDQYSSVGTLTFDAEAQTWTTEVTTDAGTTETIALQYDTLRMLEPRVRGQ